jgi:hypothetical protein
MVTSSDAVNETNDSTSGSAAAPQAPDIAAIKSNPSNDASEISNNKRWLDSSDRRKKTSERSMNLPNTSQVSDDAESSLGNLFATKDNSAFKWQRTRDILGALEVPSEPSFRFRDPLVPRTVKGREVPFEEALGEWRILKMREDFIHSCENLPSEMCCCGLLSDQDGTKRRFATLLNEGWCKRTNKMLLKNKSGWKVDAFLWNWQNASGKAETNILLIRFIQTSSYRFSKAIDEGSVDFELLHLDEDDSLSSNEGDFDKHKPAPDSSPPEEAKMER